MNALCEDAAQHSLSALELAKQTGYDQIMIGESSILYQLTAMIDLLTHPARIMRVITAIGFADETGYQSYRANKVTEVQNTAGARGGFILSYDTHPSLKGRAASH